MTKQSIQTCAKRYPGCFRICDRYKTVKLPDCYYLQHKEETEKELKQIKKDRGFIG